MIKKVFIGDEQIGKIFYTHQVHDNTIFVNLFLLFPKYRNGGNFKILFNTMLGIAKEKDVKTLYLSVGSSDKTVSDDYLYSLYQRYGFVGERKRMVLDIRNL